MASCYSVVVPIFNEAEVLPTLYQRLRKVMEAVGEPYELIFVNDGSTDQSPGLLLDLRAQDPCVKVVSFSRNFGHQIAITAGLDYSSGDAVIVMDGDLQDPPEVIPELVAQWRAGNEIVFAVRANRNGDAFFKRITASLFYRILGRLTTTQIPVDAGDFRLMSRVAVEALKPIRERNRFVRGLVGWIGFRHTSIRYVRDSRFAGTTKYPLTKMIQFALNGIFSFSLLPLQLATYLGLTVSLISFIYLAYAVWLKVFTTRAVQGWASVIVAVLFMGGVQLVSLGIVGEYIGRIYEEVKQRPLYLVDSLAGFEKVSPQSEAAPPYSAVART
ncbi:MAG: glycosyltransferase family 2 protein [Gemmatimonadales bacterium]|nr:glycosyltransferase family 2 protein [Gemmatimonadales bacterium]